MIQLTDSAHGNPSIWGVFRDLFLSMPDAVFLANAETGFLIECNPAAERLLGLSRNEIVGKPHTFLHPPENLEFYRTLFEKHIADRGGYSVDVEVCRSTGERRWVSINSSIVTYDDARYIIGIFRDIMDRRRLEKELRDSKERLALATQGTGIGIWDYDTETDHLTWDEEMFRLYGVDPAHFGHRFEDWSRTVLPKALPRALEEFQAALRGEKEFRIEFPVVLPDGAVRYLAGAGYVAHNDDGAPVRVVGVNYDITERKEQQLAIEKAKNEWERTFDTVPDLITILDKNYRIVRANKAMAERLGRSPKACCGLLCYPDAHGSDKPPEVCPFAMLLEDGKPHTLEIEEPHLGGTFQVTASPLLNAKGDIEGCVHVAHDITELKRMQEEIVKKERVATAGILAAGVAHEFNNAITSVIGYMQILSEDGRFPDSLRDLLDKALASSRRVSDLTQTLMAFTEKRLQRPMRFSLGDEVNRVYALMEEDMEAQGIDVRLDVAPSTDVHGIPGEIAQVVVHLLGNAAHALIDQEKKSILLSVRRKPPFAVLAVEDTGVGLPPEDIPKLFVPFFSRKGEKGVPDSPLQKVKGSGLGLSICQHIVDKHNGRIAADNREEGGAVFRVSLPLDQGTA